MDNPHAIVCSNSCVLILLVALLCAERGQMENERGTGGYNGDGKGPQGCGYTCTSIVCVVTEVSWSKGIRNWLVMVKPPMLSAGSVTLPAKPSSHTRKSLGPHYLCPNPSHQNP